MNLRAIISSSIFIRSILALSIFLLLFISSISYRHTNELTKTTELLVHSYKVQVKLAQLYSYVQTAETGQRGYLISKDSIFLEPYKSAESDMDTVIHELKTLTANNVQQFNNLDSLLALIHRRFDFMARTLILDRQEGLDRRQLTANLNIGMNIMDLIQIQINKMVDQENMYVDDHQKKYAHELHLTPLSTLYLVLFSLMVFVFAFVKINNDLVTLKKTNAALQLSTKSFNHAEEIGSFSSWQWHIDTGLLLFSDNHYHLLGVEPQSFEPSIANFQKYVHPDDRHKIEEGRRLAVEKNIPSVISFRIIRADGEVRHIKSVAKLTDFHDNKIFIGINSDITEQYISNIALEERNRELEQTNTELASFNHIASHDLQEPLRKIQTFISRIIEKEQQVLSPASQEYFSRIQISVKKMRNLINDLLLFSRAGKTEKIFKKADLNTLLENAQQELISDIEEKQAVIHSMKLPELNVVPFQIQQLFLNLIGNSIKYSKPGVPPVINIEVEIADLPENLQHEKSNSKYYKISISDNGEGFEQEYAENIFMLFYRLHPKSESPGSGIGLAICKKIVENHDGFVFARGNPGTGSTFTFFLPMNLS